MQDALLWGAVAALAALGMLLLGILRWVALIARQLALNETAAERADTIAAGAMGKCELLGTDFHNHRVETAAKVATIEAKAENASAAIILAEGRLAKSIDDIRASIERLVERLDRMMENNTSL